MKRPAPPIAPPPAVRLQTAKAEAEAPAGAVPKVAEAPRDAGAEAPAGTVPKVLPPLRMVAPPQAPRVVPPKVQGAPPMVAPAPRPPPPEVPPPGGAFEPVLSWPGSVSAEEAASSGVAAALYDGWMPVQAEEAAAALAARADAAEDGAVRHLGAPVGGPQPAEATPERVQAAQAAVAAAWETANMAFEQWKARHENINITTFIYFFL